MKRLVLFLFLLTLSLPAFAAENQATAILLDNSKSVPASDFEQAKKAVDQFVQDSTGPTTVYVFGDTVKKISSNDLVALQPTASYTMVYDAAYDAAKELAAIDAKHRTLIIISDGLDTKSATVLEDIVSFANNQGIAIYGIGVGKANRKSLERMAILTGGKYVDMSSAEPVREIESGIAAQKEVPKKEEARTVVVQQPAPARATPVQSQPVQNVPEEQPSTIPYKWILILLLGAVVLSGAIYLIARSYKSQERSCPTCGRQLEAYQTVCPNCSVADTKQTKLTSMPDVTSHENGDEPTPIPLELLQKKPVTEEMLSKTFVLMETPMLVVRKGKNLGQSFSLNRSFPVSIGRSRVNEIRLDDITISAQHCRIIPENGRHILCDLNSTNGTFLNEKKVSRQLLNEGDTIRVGETQFLYKVEQSRTWDNTEKF
jgi:FHA domain-containing protein/von Willebrand factor type A domain-containing protein